MKQVLLRKGVISVEDVPSPAQHPNHLLVEVSRSLISTGTELASVHLSGASLVEKAKQKPKEVQKVLDSIRLRGVKRTYELVQGKLDESKPLGYSCAGRVIAVGHEITGFRVGDRVACAGAGLANHAEIISVPANLAVKIPEGVSDTSASFVTLGAIAMQGVRRADLKLGESVCVLGLGLLGQLTVQLLVAAGCKVIGMDVNETRVTEALHYGMMDGATSNEELKSRISILTAGYGVDATIITASTSSSEPAQQSFVITRKKGRIVVVGSVGMELDRSPFYEKEQDFLISCSYGPGRYDPQYETQGQDYPYAYVRWTENRNMSAFLDLVARGKVNVEPMIGQEFPIADATKAYAALEGKGTRPLTVVLTYQEGAHRNGHEVDSVAVRPMPRTQGKIRLALIGVGNFVKSTHLPNLKRLSEKVEIAGVCAANSASAATVARQCKTTLVATDFQDILKNPNVDAVLIATRHDQHAVMAEAALRAGKHVYLEKPVALTEEEVERLDKTLKSLLAQPVFMLGFNRRYAPASQKVAEALARRKGPLIVNYRVNAGMLPMEHWALSAEGGGRLRGEACHMIDLFQFFTKSKMSALSISAVSGSAQPSPRPDENFAATFCYEDGSLANLVYTSLGHPQLPKEYIELHWDGQSAVIEDFAEVSLYGTAVKELSSRQDKGHLAALQTFLDSIARGTSFPTPWAGLKETTLAAALLDKDVWGRLS